jgi:Tol biopolymer transport system component
MRWFAGGLAVGIIACGSGAGQPDASPSIDSPAAPTTCAWDAAFDPPVEVAELSGANNDWDARLTADQLTVYFTSDRPGGQGGNDIYIAMRSSIAIPFGAPSPVAAVDTASLDAAPSLAGDGLALYFTSDRAAAVPSIFVSTRTDINSPWGGAQSVAGLGTGQNDFSPMVASGSGTLYFTSLRSGARDLYTALRTNPTAFASPTAIAELDSPDDESYPTISSDEKTIYYGRSQVGGTYDVWVAHRDRVTDPFGTPRAVTELNTASSNDVPGWLSPDGCTLYLSSDRAGGAGMLDIWVAHRNP